MKKFLKKLSYTLLPVFLLLFGLTAYVTLYVLPRTTGDLGHLALIPFGCFDDGTDEMKELLYMNVNQSDSLRNVHADVLTVGDSFSRMGRFGYQNYLAAEGVSVVNCARELYENPLQYAYNILDMGLVDSTNISVLVVQVGERDLVSRAEEFDIDEFDMNELDPEPPFNSSNGNPNAWSLLRARDYLVYRLHWSPVFKVTLDKDYFNSKEPRSLYFYCADITNGVNIGEASKQKIQEVYQILTRKAKERGIALILMIPVDKYDIYQDHIVDNSYPHKTYVEDAREIFGDTPNVLLCKYLLTSLIEKGEKDVFLFDDSHWGIRASEIVGKELSHRIKTLMHPHTS
jgi:hypothetical protein